MMELPFSLASGNYEMRSIIRFLLEENVPTHYCVMRMDKM